MTAFQVNRGGVIFRKDFDQGAFRTSEKDPRFAISRTGKEQILSGFLLVPRSTEMRQNTEVLKKFVDRVILAE